jgi:glutamate-1-semialdehyde 2,1-aminomutase
MSKLWTRYQNVIAQGCLTNSKHPRSHIQGVYPKTIKYAIGACVYDESDKQYVDFICGLGTNLLGYGNSAIAKRVGEFMHLGYSPSFGTAAEVIAAEKLVSLFPFAEKIKFLKTGSEACLAAIKIARAHTGRSLVLSDGYHGFGDAFINLTEPALGVDRTVNTRKLIDYDGDFSNVAAVIVEPIITDASQERLEYLRDLKAKCNNAGALLIFDEVITGFRYPKFSVSNYYGIEPDLIVLGKAMAGGFPLACVGGKTAVMDGEYFVSSTYAGEILSLTACSEVINQLTKGSYKLEELWRQGGDFIRDFNTLCGGLVWIEGYNTRGVIKAKDDMTKALFFQECCKAGVIFGPSWFYNFQHENYKDVVVAAVRHVIGKIRLGAVKLEGEMPQLPFAQKQREAKS